MPKAVPDAPARYRAFLSALRRTANAELAFRQSGVNRSWAYWRRKRDADFARDWAAALAAGRERLAIEPPVKPTWDGVPLVLTGGWGSKSRRLRRVIDADFTDARKRLFLAALGATCNVSAAARAAGVQPGTARRHRAASAPFRAAWAVALDDGRVTLEFALLKASLALFDTGLDDDPAPDEGLAIRSVDAQVALQTLRLHMPDRRGRSGPKASDPAVARAAILRGAAVIRAHNARAFTGGSTHDCHDPQTCDT